MRKNRIYIIFLPLLSYSLCSQNISTVAGNGSFSFSGDNGPATSASFNSPKDIAVDQSGNIYIADILNHRVRKIDALGIITTFAGNGTQGYSGDNGPATSAQLYRPHGVAVDSTGNIYIADGFNNVIRKVNTSGIISTIAGTGVSGYSGDNGPAITAQLAYPTDVAIDPSGNILIVDWFNNVLRKVDNSGIITRVAGNPSATQLGDGGPATLANLNNPQNIAIDNVGNIFIADGSNQRIRKVDTSGIISTVAGNGNMAYSGDGGLADTSSLSNPYGVAVDAWGNIYIADGGNNRIRKVDVFGIISTVGGTGACGFSGDGGPATLATLCGPVSLTFDNNGNLLISDDSNSRVRRINAVVGVHENYSEQSFVSLFPNPSSGTINISPFGLLDGELWVSLRDIAGKLIYRGTNSFTDGVAVYDLDVKDGIYFVSIQNKDTGQHAVRKLIIQK